MRQRRRWLPILLLAACALALPGRSNAANLALQDTVPDLQEAQTESASVSIPRPLTPLLLYTDERLVLPGDLAGKRQAVSATFYPRGSKTYDWTFELEDEELNDSCTYDLTLGSAGTTSVTLEVVLKQSRQEAVLATDKMSISSKRYTQFQNTLPLAESVPKAGDEVILRLKVRGDPYGVALGPESSLLLLEAAGLPATLEEERAKALRWMTATSKFGAESDLFTRFQGKLDFAISACADAEWGFGAGLTVSEKPYMVRWTNGSFEVEELTLEAAEELEIEESSVRLKFMGFGCT